MKIPYYQKLTLLDYPGKTAVTVFTDGCNLRCPFCHNASLVERHPDEYIDPEELFSYLKKRIGLLDGVCITGGEPLLQNDLGDLINRIRALGYAVKLDTNGTLPERLEPLLADGLLDYVAMDFKNALEKYPLTVGMPEAQKDSLIERIERSVALITRLAPDFEFRTTVVASLHTPHDTESIAAYLAHNASPDVKYYIQCFKDSGDILCAGLSAPDKTALDAMLHAARTHLPCTELRGV